MKLRRFYLWCLVATLVLEISKACINTPEYFGNLVSSSEITSSTLVNSATSCNCCGLCYQNAACKSFSFGTDNKECVLYNKVGDYGEFMRERENSHNTEFFFLPNRSQTNEFCRSDSDCVTEGDFCRGRICTTDTTITCRDAFDQNNALPDHRYWGFIKDRELLLRCRMEGDYRGATLLLASHDQPTDGVHWSTENILYKTHERDNYPNEWTDYSILRYADVIRDSRGGKRYDVHIIAYEHQDNPQQVQSYSALKTLTLIGREMVPFANGDFTAEPPMDHDDGWLAFPHLKNIDGCLYSTLNSEARYLDWRAIVRTSGAPWWPLEQPRATVVMYIRE